MRRARQMQIGTNRLNTPSTNTRHLKVVLFVISIVFFSIDESNSREFRSFGVFVLRPSPPFVGFFLVDLWNPSPHASAPTPGGFLYR